MSSKGLQSCLEPPSRLVEPRVLMQNLAPQKSTTLVSQSIPWPQRPIAPPQPQQHERHGRCDFVDSKCQNGNAVWSSIQALADASQNPKTQAAAAYVHPLVKRSSSMLSDKSLETCTESLGSETGSSIGERIDDFPSPQPERSNPLGNHQPRKLLKKTDRSVRFPPPLTSISGSGGGHMRAHREGGRLVLKAVRNVSSRGSSFQAERANGRLRLSFLKDGFKENGSAANVRNDGEVGEGKLEDADVEGLIHRGDEELEDLEGNAEKVGFEIGVGGELPRPSRCCEGGTSNPVIPSWCPCLVPIS